MKPRNKKKMAKIFAVVVMILMIGQVLLPLLTQK